MVTPDSIVTARGEQLTLTRVSSFDTGRDGVSNVTREYEAIPGIVSQPSEEAAQRLEGRLESGAITVTVPSGTDVRSDRDGGRDRLIRPATDPGNVDSSVRVYTVEDVQDDTHALTGTRKVTLTCSEFGGREDLSEDASQYTQA
jgi:hypothetical protein